LIKPMNSKSVSYFPCWILFYFSISWIYSSVASWPNLFIASRHYWIMVVHTCTEMLPLPSVSN
jgi:hypothetical protein